MTKETDLVMDYERKQGRNPKDVSKKRLGYDIKSDDRFIEVKKREAKAGFVFLTDHEFTTFLQNKNAYLYLVYYKGKKLKLRIFKRDIVLKNSRISTIRYRFKMRKAVKERAEQIDLS